MRAFPAFLLVMISVPRICAASIVVAEPTGDAEPAFLAELKRSLETVSAEISEEANALSQARAMAREAIKTLIAPANRRIRIIFGICRTSYSG